MPTDLAVHIRDGAARDHAAIVETLTCAIAATPIARWILPGSEPRARHLRARLTTVVAERTAARCVRVADDGARIIGATVWTACSARSESVSLWSALLDTGGDLHRSRLLEARLIPLHPAEPHHHLLAVGVRPNRQQQGVGATLLDDWHDQLRPHPAPAFLLAPTTLLRLARDAGYLPLGEPITATLTAPRLYAMSRPRFTFLTPPPGNGANLLVPTDATTLPLPRASNAPRPDTATATGMGPQGGAW